MRITSAKVSPKNSKSGDDVGVAIGEIGHRHRSRPNTHGKGQGGLGRQGAR